MVYNILLIDEYNLAYETKKLLDELIDKNIIIANDQSTLSAIIQENNTHLIIINTQIVTLDTLVSLFEKVKIDYTHIPILILGNDITSKNKENSAIIFDYVDNNFDEKVIYNKVKFCQQLYKKELQHEDNIRKLLYIDNLTQLPNRVKLIRDLQDDSIGINSLAIIDIKAFKEINDFFGYRVGDNVLKIVVNIINNIISLIEGKVTLYKFPSDVYCIANRKLSQKDFKDIIVYVLGGIRTEIIREGEHELSIRAAAGISFSPKKNKLITADLALQAVKKQNKDYLVFYDELDNLREYENNMLWTRKLKKALDKDNIIVYYQPLINNKTMKVDKYECLVRMYDEDDDKVISPFFFLDISRKANQYKDITKIVIEKSFKEFENLDFEFSINISYEDISDEIFLIFIEDRLKKYNVANRVVWEILEDECIKDYDVLINFITKIKKMGCKIAIDDFGSGYSNFEHILKMDIDYLKIDASLVKNIATDKNSYKVVKTVIDFAKSLEIKTIAEYVENEDIFNITKELGVDFSQGCYFSSPIPKPKLKNFSINYL